MSEYINRDDLKERLQYVGRGMTVLDVVDSVSAADVEPVRHGRWVWNPDGMDWGLGAWLCSECSCRNDNLPHNKMATPSFWAGTKYCPNCGAKMDGK